MKKRLPILIGAIAMFLIAFIYYYVTLPAISLHSQGMWWFLIFLVVACGFVYAAFRVRTVDDVTSSLPLKIIVGIVAVLAIVFLIGSILSSPIVNAKKYQQLLTVEDRNFAEDIVEVSYNQIPLLDKDSSLLLGDRKMGSMVDMVSQFEVSDRYNQINYQDKPVRVSPLVYASPIKWLTNQSKGIPAYMMIDMTTQDTTCVKLEEGIRYSESEHFNRNIYRHLRFRYPTYIFADFSFEIDDNGVPYWICPVKKFNIGLFGGQTFGKVVICNAVTGECTEYDINNVPQWVDRVYPTDMLVNLYNYHGTLQNGYFNSVLGQKGCLQTTDGYNYLALEDDVWVYTGITSLNADQSIVGFVLMNQRTMETRYYSVEGAIEYSAMSSAEGQVQNLGYQATFPLLLNIADEPTYFIALKDDAGLVKKYAMVNVQKYQWVAIGDTVAECERSYVSLLNTNGISGGSDSSSVEVTGKITKMAPITIEGNTHYYLCIEGNEGIYDIDMTDSALVNVLFYNEGDTIHLKYVQGSSVCEVTEIIE